MKGISEYQSCFFSSGVSFYFWSTMAFVKKFPNSSAVLPSASSYATSFKSSHLPEFFDCIPVCVVILWPHLSVYRTLLFHKLPATCNLSWRSRYVCIIISKKIPQQIITNKHLRECGFNIENLNWRVYSVFSIVIKNIIFYYNIGSLSLGCWNMNKFGLQ